MRITAGEMHFKTLNDIVKESLDDEVVIDNCIGQRYIASGRENGTIIINGTPGNALGAYLDGSVVVVNGNAQDATGDTMNEGEIIIYGSSGDATGYAMRGGKIFVRDNAGYRAGIHMKAYKEKLPVLVIGGCAGSFLGEYQAGGIIVVLGLGSDKKTPIGDFCGTGMHGGKIYIRCEELPADLPPQVVARECTDDDMAEIDSHILEYCDKFSVSKLEIFKQKFYILIPNTKNPYKQLYTHN
ncbi:MAG: glutamate synthase [Oscillospiraceae bacterium]|jgi:glutamate synthase domain-containing protein 3